MTVCRNLYAVKSIAVGNNAFIGIAYFSAAQRDVVLVKYQALQYGGLRLKAANGAG